MKKVFVSTSFSGQVDYETGQVLPEFRRNTEEILEALRSIGKFTVFCAVEHEGWVISDQPPEVGVKKDLDEIDDSFALLALLQDSVSAGVQYEMGYADAKGKKILAATPEGVNLAYFNEGVANLGRLTPLSYRDSDHLASKLKILSSVW